MSRIAVVATLDTKGVEASYLCERIETDGFATLLVDVGVMDDPVEGEPDVTNYEIADAAGENLDDMRAKAHAESLDRVHAMRIMSEGLVPILQAAWQDDRIAGAVGIGGAQGLNICTPAFKRLPTGVPTLAVSTIVSGRNEFGPFVGTKDMTLMHSVADIVDSPLVNSVLDNAAGAITGMARRLEDRDGPLFDPGAEVIGATMLGTTTPGVTAGRELLESHGREVVTFHPNGVGGMAMESLVREGYFDGLLDLTTVELREWVVDGTYAGGESRLDAAAETGTPQVVSVGGVDQIQAGPPDSLSDDYRTRKTHQHNQNMVTVRANAEELRETARLMARKLNRSTGPVHVYLPERGVSAVDREGAPLYDPEANTAMFDELEAALDPSVGLTRVDAHINDEMFGEAAAQGLEELIEGD